MDWIYKNKLTVLLAFHALWGLGLWMSISRFGLTISTDSMPILFGGLNLASGRGLFSFDGTFVSLWPPLYSMLLALLDLVLRSDPFVSATVLQALAYLATSLCLSLLFLRIFPGNFWQALAGNILADMGVQVLFAVDAVGSDYLHYSLVILFLLLAGNYLVGKPPRSLWPLCLVGMLAMLQRYLGLALIATGALVMLFPRDMSWRRKILHSALMAVSALPAGIWLVVISPLASRRAPITFGENFRTFSMSALQWLFPVQLKQPGLWFYISALWLLMAVLLLLLLRFSRKQPLPLFALPVLLYGAVYLLALFGAASITYFNKLDGRFLLPLYVPFIMLLLLVLDGWLRGLQVRGWSRPAALACSGTLMLLGIGLLRISLPVGWQSHLDGNVEGNDFNNQAWHTNSALRYWLGHEPPGSPLVFSNYPDGIAFYTWQAAYHSPVQYAGPYGKQEFPVSGYASSLFSSGADVYIIWIEPNIYPFYYPVQALGPIAWIQPLFVSRDGGVYRLRCKPSITCPAQP